MIIFFVIKGFLYPHHFLKTMEKEQLKGFIVKKLFHHGYIGGRHTDIENLKKGLPGHFKGDVKEAVGELVKEGILMQKPTSYGLHVSLDPRKKGEIESYLR
jgi:hypothetical protein